jgi:hypothetical protein
MNETQILLSNRDSLLVAIPFLLMLFISVFRLDQIIAAPKGAQNRRRPSCGIDEFGDPILCDPDGKMITAQRSNCDVRRLRPARTI